MKFDVFGRVIEVVRENDEWVIYDLGEGKKRMVKDFYIPSECEASEIAVYLDDLFHESATPERSKIITIIE